MKYLYLILTALTLRLLCLGVIQLGNFQTLIPLNEYESLFKNPESKMQLMDASDFYYTSLNLEVPKVTGDYWGYSEWYQRSPLHTLVLYLTNQSILFQIGLSVLTCLLLFKINTIAGWIYAFYPQSIIYSNLYTKVTLMLFLFVLCMYLFGEKPYLIVVSAVAIQLLFISSFNINPQTTGILTEFNKPIIDKMFNLWKPFVEHTPVIFGKWLIYIQILPYSILMFLFIRKVRFNYAWIIFIIFTIGAGLQYAHTFHREFIMPVFLISVLETINSDNQ